MGYTLSNGQCSRLDAIKFLSILSDYKRLSVAAVLYNILSSVLPILLFLVGGYGLGKVLPKLIVQGAVKRITQWCGLSCL